MRQEIILNIFISVFVPKLKSPEKFHLQLKKDNHSTLQPSFKFPALKASHSSKISKQVKTLPLFLMGFFKSSKCSHKSHQTKKSHFLTHFREKPRYCKYNTHLAFIFPTEKFLSTQGVLHEVPLASQAV